MESTSTNLMDANRLERFLARIFDLWFQYLIFVFLAFLFFFKDFVDFIGDTSNRNLFNFAIFPTILILDALIYKIANNTPGKALLGLKVLTADGKPLTFLQYLKRNFLLWVHGFAFGLPIIYLFAMLWQAIRIGKGKPASYDEPYGYKVYKRKTGYLRLVFFFIMSVLISFATILMILIVVIYPNF